MGTHSLSQLLLPSYLPTSPPSSTSRPLLSRLSPALVLQLQVNQVPLANSTMPYSNTDTICYDITLTGVTGDYQSAALTATHIHQGLKGASGPPRIVFPNPGPITDGVRRSVGCLTGPFVTGIKGADNVTDTGAGFKLSQIEANPAGFFTDSHTALFVPGAVRGQLDRSFKLIDSPSIPPSGNGSVITTATLTKTVDVTITQCPAAKTDCPANEKYPAVVKTAVVYTTVCPVSELPYY